MTTQEFKAWFEGFTEAFTGQPTKAQWARIKARVAEIDGATTTERVFIDRYWPTYYPRVWYTASPYVYCTSSGTVYGATSGPIYSATTSMYALGKADASTMGEAA